MSSVLRCFVGILSFAFSLFSWAETGLQFNAFATLAATRGNDSVLGFLRDISHEEASTDGDLKVTVDSLLGLQIGSSLTSKLDWTVQAVLRDRPKQSLDQSIEWAFLRYMANESTTLRLGRMGVDIFMLSDYRNVGYAYHWVR